MATVDRCCAVFEKRYSEYITKGQTRNNARSSVVISRNYVGVATWENSEIRCLANFDGIENEKWF